MSIKFVNKPTFDRGGASPWETKVAQRYISRYPWRDVRRREAVVTWARWHTNLCRTTYSLGVQSFAQYGELGTTRWPCSWSVGANLFRPSVLPRKYAIFLVAYLPDRRCQSCSRFRNIGGGRQTLYASSSSCLNRATGNTAKYWTLVTRSPEARDTQTKWICAAIFCHWCMWCPGEVSREMHMSEKSGTRYAILRTRWLNDVPNGI